MRKTIDVVRDVIIAIIEADREPGTAPTGCAIYEGGATILPERIRGRVPSKIRWTASRGQHAWEGALFTLKALGVDIGQPLNTGDTIPVSCHCGATEGLREDPYGGGKVCPTHYQP